MIDDVELGLQIADRLLPRQLRPATAPSVARSFGGSLASSSSFCLQIGDGALERSDIGMIGV